jgi:hypothetical protein
MTGKNIASVVLFIIALVGGRYAFEALFAESEVASFDESKWKQCSYAGITFDSPFELEEVDMEIPLTLRSYVKEMKNFVYESKSLTFFISKAEYKSGIPVDIDGAIDGALSNMEMTEGVSDFTFDVQTIDKNNSECRKATGKFRIDKYDSEFVALMHVKKSTLVQILSTNLSYDENRSVRDRIFESLNVKL